MAGEIQERVLRDRNITGSLARIMKGRSVSMEIKRGIRIGLGMLRECRMRLVERLVRSDVRGGD